jgi:hypothetical protein
MGQGYTSAVNERQGRGGGGGGGRKSLLFLKKKKQKDFWTRFAVAGLAPQDATPAGSASHSRIKVFFTVIA